ncbi:DUF6011 domain-containing protein [Nocardioides taihuensis]|uniref:DUF6011 domain-containing protein n=1 Tax=Nocardioides taihuensis TaxID=1835606 RepID=A0ABW0BQW7_9ACTN
MNPVDSVIKERGAALDEDSSLFRTAVDIATRQPDLDPRMFQIRVANAGGVEKRAVQRLLENRKDVFTIGPGRASKSSVRLRPEWRPSSGQWNVIRSRFRDGRTTTAILHFPAGRRLIPPVVTIDRVAHDDELEAWVTIRVQEALLWARWSTGACCPKGTWSLGLPLDPAPTNGMPGQEGLLCWRTASVVAATQYLQRILIEDLRLSPENMTVSYRIRSAMIGGATNGGARRRKRPGKWCSECGQPLTTPASIRAGMGPTCSHRARHGGSREGSRGDTALGPSEWQQSIAAVWE